MNHKELLILKRVDIPIRFDRSTEEVIAGKMAVLIGIEYLRAAVLPDCFLQDFNAKVVIQTV